MLQEANSVGAYVPGVEDFPPPFDRNRWEVIRNRLVDELAKGNGRTLEAIANAARVEVGPLKIWLKSPAEFPRFGRRVGEKTGAEKIADALEGYFAALDSEGLNIRLRCPRRVETGVMRAAIEGIWTARNLCEFVEIRAASGLGKTEAKAEYIARCRKSEGFYCPVWSIELDESCISIKAVLSMIAREVVGEGHYDEKSEASMARVIEEYAEGRNGVLLVDEAQHLADAQKRFGIPIVNMLRRFVDKGLFGIAYFGNGEIYRRLTTGSGKDKGAYTQLLSRMQDFRVEIFGLGANTGKGKEHVKALTREDVVAVAAAWGVDGVEEVAYCLKAAALPGSLRIMTNIFRQALDKYECIDIKTLNKVRRL